MSTNSDSQLFSNTFILRKLENINTFNNMRIAYIEEFLTLTISSEQEIKQITLNTLCSQTHCNRIFVHYSNQVSRLTNMSPSPEKPEQG